MFTSDGRSGADIQEVKGRREPSVGLHHRCFFSPWSFWALFLLPEPSTRLRSSARSRNLRRPIEGGGPAGFQRSPPIHPHAAWQSPNSNETHQRSWANKASCADEKSSGGKIEKIKVRLAWQEK